MEELIRGLILKLGSASEIEDHRILGDSDVDELIARAALDRILKTYNRSVGAKKG